MGDAESGSSSAAQSAQDQTETSTGGLLGRLVGAFWAPGDDTPKTENPDTGMNGTANAAATLGMLNLRRMQLEDVAVPKAEIVSVPVDIHKDDLVKVFRESGLTRLPVYKGTLDSPLGMVHLKDFALFHGFNGGGGRFSLRKMLRPLLFAPPSMPIGVLLQKMQSQRMHLALVIDEYGGVDGLVSIEDLIEQVIGEIEDEHDIEEDELWLLEKPGCYLAQAKTPLDEFQVEIGQRLVEAEDEEEIDTLGGLVFMLSGRVPARGEVIPHPGGTEFEIVDADPRRIKRLRVRVPMAEGP
ncbi:Magnesium and cobalt efflux protein CorC [Candidatus Rhodobacter oscarellae]|uniref:Magnesium and cobalt efflux protein CorC n=2 Tax=Candidatus Rhodobacter oscarellae TaxID=1675527 RepID=A0A0J9E189_9RHOB|nr:transporter associated domain-containing protein [Candidatus Rhodobacter lobularis]KMW56452.1 Magnesium and cobalt efflux protein CorC [Candidatus Rhodobacter lobularis]